MAREPGKSEASGRESMRAMRRWRMEKASEKARSISCGAPCGGWIGHSPMSGDGLAGPDGADLVGGVVADGKDEVEMRRAGRGELIPGFASQARGAEAGGFDVPEGFRADRAGGMAAGAIGSEVRGPSSS